jgi:hypothetical protein
MAVFGTAGRWQTEPPRGERPIAPQDATNQWLLDVRLFREATAQPRGGTRCARGLQLRMSM